MRVSHGSRSSALRPRSRKLRFIPSALVLVAFTACKGAGPTTPQTGSGPVGYCSSIPFRLVNLRQIDARPEWATWYRDAESCSGHQGNYWGVRWFLVDAIEETDGTPTTVVGISCLDNIYLLNPTSEPTVRHEILHHVLGMTGHPSEYFPSCGEALGAGSNI